MVLVIKWRGAALGLTKTPQPHAAPWRLELEDTRSLTPASVTFHRESFNTFTLKSEGSISGKTARPSLCSNSLKDTRTGRARN